MDIQAYALVAAISIVVIGGYISILMRRGKRRDEFFKNAGCRDTDLSVAFAPQKLEI